MNLKNLVLWIMIAFVFILGIYMIYYIRTESYQCLNNPYTYSIKLLEEANDAEVTAIISVHKPNGLNILLTREGFSILDLPKQSQNINTNITFELNG